MKKIEIIVAEKIATPVGSPYIVCGNDDYIINFTFDSEWDGKTQKTARFKYLKGGQTRYEDITFNGTICPVPILSDITAVSIGVYVGDLETTTPAIVECRKSILCGDGTHETPSEDVYNQLIEAINTGLVKGDQGIQGQQGPQGVSGVYVGGGEMPEGYNVQIDPTGEGTILIGFANALKGNASGNPIRIDDVSPLAHEMAVGVRTKNLISYPYSDTTQTINGITFTDNGDGTIIANGTADENATFYIERRADFPYLNKDEEYVLSGCPEGGGTYTYQLQMAQGGTYTTDIGKGKTFVAIEGVGNIIIKVLQGTTVNNIVFKPQIEKGTTATPYTPFVDVNGAMVQIGIGTNEATTYTADENGIVKGIIGNGEDMTLTADSGAIISVEYNRDINAIKRVIVEDVPARYDSAYEARLSVRKMITAGKKYKLYYYSQGWGTYEGEAVATLQTIGGHGTVLALNFEFSHPGGGIMNKYIFNKNAGLWIRDTDNDGVVLVTLEEIQ